MWGLLQFILRCIIRFLGRNNLDQSLSIVIPVFNEEAMLDRAVAAVCGVVSELDVEYEIILVDDGSTDGSWTLINRLAREIPQVVGLRFTRNFGKESAIQAGLRSSRGQKVLVMDADLQHPPEMIPQMLEASAEHMVVEAVKIGDSQSLAYRFARLVFYGALRRTTGRKIMNSTDFKLMDRTVVDALLAFPENIRFFRGLVAWSGYSSTSIEFVVPKRPEGESKWGLLGLLGYAFRAVGSFSSFPLTLVAWLGALTVLFGLGLGVQTLYMKFSGQAVEGFTTVILAVILFSGITLLALGVIGLYLARIYEEVKGRPQYVVAQTTQGRDENG